MRYRLKRIIKRFIERLIKRKIILLALENDVDILPLQFNYRASEQGLVTYQMQMEGHDMVYALSPMKAVDGEHIATQPSMMFKLPNVVRGDILEVNIVEQSARLNRMLVDVITTDNLMARKYTVNIKLQNGERLLSRDCIHYLPFAAKPIGKDYYFGDDYIDYPNETNTPGGLKLITQYVSNGRLLDVGCALGLYTEAFLNAGFDAYGIDVSEYAVTEARKRVGDDRVEQCDIDAADIPFDFKFDIFWLFDVLEHSAVPFDLLRKVTRKANPEALLFIHTTNAESLAHRLFEEDWEAHSDYSHLGADIVSVSNLTAWMQTLGWEIIHWQCDRLIWVSNSDPINVRLRDVFNQFPELKILVTERNWGDIYLMIARMKPQP